MNDDSLYLLHIRECIAQVKEYADGGKTAFLADRKTQDAVLRNLQIMAESTTRLSDDLRKRHPGVDWRGLAGFRNILVHAYLGINLVRVWNVIEQDLPALEKMADAELDGPAGQT